MIPNYILKNGIEIPCIAYGTVQEPGTNMENVYTGVRCAIEYGYRHFDCAQMYYNEEFIGQALEESGLPRSAFFITTKLHNHIGDYKGTIDAFHESLKKLRTDYADLFLIHWPNPFCHRGHWEQRNAECWRAMEDLEKNGEIRTLGVSNFRPKHLNALMLSAREEPLVNQVRLFPGDSALHMPTIDYCKNNHIQLEGYSPLGIGECLNQPIVKETALKYAHTPAQICLRWSLQKGYLPLPKSITPSRIRDNLNVFDFTIGKDDMDRLDAMPASMIDDRDPDLASW